MFVCRSRRRRRSALSVARTLRHWPIHLLLRYETAVTWYFPTDSALSLQNDSRSSESHFLLVHSLVDLRLAVDAIKRFGLGEGRVVGDTLLAVADTLTSKTKK
jgi:hypothetical protein